MPTPNIGEFLENFISLPTVQRMVVRDAIEGLTRRSKKICPVCEHEFENSWDKLDIHWRANHEDLCSYEAAWKIIHGMEKANEGMKLSKDQTG